MPFDLQSVGLLAQAPLMDVKSLYHLQEVCLWQCKQKYAYCWRVGGHFAGLRQCTPYSSFYNGVLLFCICHSIVPLTSLDVLNQEMGKSDQKNEPKGMRMEKGSVVNACRTTPFSGIVFTCYLLHNSRWIWALRRNQFCSLSGQVDFTGVLCVTLSMLYVVFVNSVYLF